MTTKIPLGIFHSKLVLWVLGLVILGLAIGIGIYYWPFQAKKDWKTISGCIEIKGKEINFQFLSKKEWEEVGVNMGCGKLYPDSQSWGLKSQKVGEQTLDIALISVLAESSKPSDYNHNSFAYFAVSGQPDAYIVLQRVTADIKGQSFGISDSEWQYLKRSFKFR